MTKTVTSLFHSVRHAETAARRLEQAGIPKHEIDIWSEPINLAPLLEDGGVSRADAHAYAEGVMRGGSVIIVSCANDKVAEVVRILDDEGVLDLDEQQASWRSEGWEGPEAERPERESHGRFRIQTREDRPDDRPGDWTLHE